jgi:hypothetical protein
VTWLYSKLGAANRAQALMTAMHYGLIHYKQDSQPLVTLPQRSGKLRRTGALTLRN